MGVPVISFPTATGYHPGFTARNQSKQLVDFSESPLTFGAWKLTDPLSGQPTPWLTKTSALGGGIVVTGLGVFRIDFNEPDTLGMAGTFPFEVKRMLANGEERLVTSGFLVLYPRRFNP